MKKIIDNLRTNWITYGFETLVVLVGILGAFALNNWNEGRKQRIQDVEILQNLKVQLVKDLQTFSEFQSNYQYNNSKIIACLDLFESGIITTSEDSAVVEYALTSFQILTPVHQSIEHNEFLSSNGVLIRIGGQIDQLYLEYIQKARYYDNVLQKLGETLQIIAVRDIWPYINIDNRADKVVGYDFSEIKNSRSVRNGLNNSVGMRTQYLSWMDQQEGLARELIKSIDEQLK